MNPADGLPLRERWLAFSTIGIAMTMAVLDSAIVNIALPVITRDMKIEPSSAIWVVNAYQLAVVTTLLPLAALGDAIGYRKVYWRGLALFTAASLACALSGSLPMLIVARAFQGLGAAGIMSVNIALVRFIYPQAMIGRGVGNMALVVAVSSAAGPSIGAAILAAASWPWLFLVNVPLGLVALALGSRTLPQTPASGARFDWTSALLNAATFGLLVTGIDGIADRGHGILPLLLLAGALAVGAAFVLHQLRMPKPLLPIDLLRIPVFALSMATSVCSFAAQAITLVSLPFYFQDGLHRTEAQTGLLMTPLPLAVAIMAPIAGRLADRVSPGLLGGIGLAALATGLALMATLPADPGVVDTTWRLTLCGLGFGLFQTPNNKLIITSAPRERSGGASGMQSTARLLGQSVGVAMVAVIFALAPHGETAIALWLAAGLAAGGCIASSLRMRR